MPMLPFRGQWPRLGDRVFIANGAQVVGVVTIGDATNIWYNAVLRGDMAAISVGAGCSIQDGCVVHVDHDMPTNIGNHVVVGHNAIIHRRHGRRSRACRHERHRAFGSQYRRRQHHRCWRRGPGAPHNSAAVTGAGHPRQGGARSDRCRASGRCDTRPALRRLWRRASCHPGRARIAQILMQTKPYGKLHSGRYG